MQHQICDINGTLTNEQALIGLCINRSKELKKARASGITADHFIGDEVCVLLWSTMMKIQEGKHELDQATVMQALQNKKKRPTNEILMAVVEIFEHAPLTLNVDYFSEIVLEQKHEKEKHDLLRAAMNRSELGLDVDLAAVAAKMPPCPTSKGLGLSGHDLTSEVREDLEQRMIASDNGTEFGIKLGWKKLDRYIHGLCPATFNVLAGRPGMGKTSMAIAFALRVMSKDVPVVFYTLEMDLNAVSKKFIANLSGVSLSKILHGNSNEHERNLIHDATRKFNLLPLTIVDETRSIDAIRADAIRKNQRGECDCVFVDYIQICDSDEKFNSMREKIIHITHTMKSLSKEINSPVVGMAQISRIKTGEIARKPTLSDLKESGSIEEDADTVMLIHRESYGGAAGGTNHLIVGKSRNGETGSVEFVCDLATNRFTEDDYANHDD